ncbi:GH25 family lysozyme [Mesorhizobium sp. M0898]|uniref:GH25 family lysozyme n=1 Tax=Mesorhizobium sp. M0898 TaxID=2957020 RepID=UPI00333AB1FD
MSKSLLLAFAVAVSILGLSFVAPPYVRAGDIDSELADLIDEPSRSDLFELVIAADVKENGPLTTQQVGEFDLRGPFTYPEDADIDRSTGLPREKSIFCVDVSHHQGRDIRFDLFRDQRIRCVYVKASQGIRFKDPLFASNWRSLETLSGQNKVLRGAYHFLSADGDPGKQADNYLRLLAKHGPLRADDLPPVLDLEWDIGVRGGADRWQSDRYSADPDQIIQNALIWLQKVESETGKTPMVYTARAWWREAIGPEAKISAFEHYHLWIADYSRSSAAVELPKVPANADWHLWQFTDRAYLREGFDRPVDSNIYKGTEADFLREFGLD